MAKIESNQLGLALELIQAVSHSSQFPCRIAQLQIKQQQDHPLVASNTTPKLSNERITHYEQYFQIGSRVWRMCLLARHSAHRPPSRANCAQLRVSLISPRLTRTATLHYTSCNSPSVCHNVMFVNRVHNLLFRLVSTFIFHSSVDCKHPICRQHEVYSCVGGVTMLTVVTTTHRTLCTTAGHRLEFNESNVSSTSFVPSLSATG